jgi:ribosome-associated protein
VAEELRIDEGLSIPLAEIELRTSRSSGPGGQHANVTESRVEVVCDLDAADLSPDVHERVTARLGRRVRSVSQAHRSQARNRAAAIAGLLARIDDAARVDIERRPTRPSAAARRRRLDAKRRRSATKQDRRRPDDTD